MFLMIIAPLRKKWEGRVFPMFNGRFQPQVTSSGATNTQQ